MEPNAPQAETSEPLWIKIARYAFVALFFGAAMLLAVGGAPAWAEWIAVAFLWTIVSLLYFSLILKFIFSWPPKSAEDQDRADGRKRPQWRSVLGYSVWKLIGFLFVAALFVSGRPILAGLYLFLWLRTVLAFVVMACLAHARVGIKRPLREALGLPRWLAYLLYAKPYRRIWNQVLPTGFWIVATVLALALALVVLPMEAAGAITKILWAMAIALLTLSGLSFLFLIFVEDGPNVVHGKAPLEWPRAVGFYGLFLLRLVFLSALCGAGQWVLAGLYLALICTASGTRWYGTFADDLDDEIYNPSIVTGLAGLCLLLGPFFVLVSPVYLLILAGKYWTDGRTARRLRETFAKHGGLVYFLYAEPHQRDHFLGAGGLLQPFREQVVARSWRDDIQPARDGPEREEFRKSPEGRLLRRFDVTRLQDHLPFVAVVPPRPWLRGFKLSKAYRERRRDKGAALRKVEEKIKKAAAKALGAKTA